MYILPPQNKFLSPRTLYLWGKMLWMDITLARNLQITCFLQLLCVSSTQSVDQWLWFLQVCIVFLVPVHDNQLCRSILLYLYSPFPNKAWFLRVCSTSLLSNEQFLLFPQGFLPFSRTFSHFHQIQNCRLQTLSVWQNLKFVVRERDN